MLEEKPLQSLSPVSKSQVLAFIVNELLCTSSIYKEIENSLDHMSNLRRDKWNMEGTIRKLKADLKTKKVSQGNSQPTDSQSSDRHLSSTPSKSKASNLNKSLNLHDSSSQDTTADDEVSNTGSTMTKDDQDEDDDDDDDEEEEEEEEEGDDDDKDSDDEDDDDDDQADDDDEEEESDDSDDETEPTTVEDIEKKVEKLEKKHSKYRHKLFTASHTLRALSLGQDRFHRRYYVLPHAGGVYVEAIESGELRDSLETVDNKNIFDSKKHIKEEPSNSETSGGPCIDQKNETVDLKSPITGGPPVKPGPMSPIGSPRLSSPVHGQFNIGNQTPTEPRPGNLTINTYSGKDSITSPNRWTNLLSPTRTQQGYLHSPPGVKPSRTKWFRVFPQAPCDETSLTRSSLIPQSPNATKPIVPPNVKLLSQDRGFIESVYSRDFSSSLTTSPSGGYGLTQQNFGGQMMSNPHFEGSVFSPGIPAVSSRYPGVNAPHPQTLKPVEGAPEGMSKAALLGLPPGTDLHKLIEQDPQKAAILLEIQSSEPQPVPEDKRYGWWRIVESDQIHKLLKTLHTRGFREKMLQKSINRHIEYACSSCKKKRDAFCLEDGEDEDDKDQNAEQLKSPKSPKKHRKMVEISSNGKIEDKWLPHVAFQMEKAILVDVEELEEKLCSASLQSKTWRPCAKVSQNLSTNLKNDTKPKEEEKPLELAKRRLLALECGIERRYLKHPFRVDKLAIPPPKSDPFQFPPDDDEPQPKILSSSEQITDGLKLWRKTVSECTSAAQLAMCVNMLRECIAWEKSIMKVICLECGKCDNEELLLLCDQCDRGTHSYCCKPKLTIIPDGDWFCRECIMMASGSDQCYGCNSANGKRLKCEYCPRYYHMQCLDPPLQKTPRAPWACPTCKKARQKSRGGSRRKKRPEDEFVEKPEKLAKPKKAKPVVDGRNNRKQAMKDMAPCQTMLAEMERHEDSWPFLVPVNAKQFPEYYQIIKHPMDFHTMKVKLRDFQYASRDEFAGDARLVFNNCDFFNEDDSEVGQAGKRMLKFFNKRWPEIKKAADQEEQEESESSSSESDSSSSSEETDSSEEEEEDEEEEEESK